jgi:hypothetical protein
MERSKYTKVEASPAAIIASLEADFGAFNVRSEGFSEEADMLLSEFPHPLLPTIGLEIELPHRILVRRLEYALPQGSSYETLAPEQKSQADDIFDAIDAEWKPKMAALKTAGMIIGRDNFAEIITPPYHHNSSLRQLTDYLFAAEFLPVGGELPLHLTVAEINVRGQNLQIQYLARMLELLEGSTDRRMLEPLMGGQRQWTRKNSDGFIQRSSSNLAGSSQHGVELRALVASDPEQLARVMWRAQWLGASLKAWLEATATERVDATREVPYEEYERGVLIDTWHGMTRFFDELYDSNGLNLRELWGGPDTNPQAWTRHFVMCSTALGNQRPKQTLCDIVDQTLHETEYALVSHYGRRVSSGRV